MLEYKLDDILMNIDKSLSLRDIVGICNQQCLGKVTFNLEIDNQRYILKSTVNSSSGNISFTSYDCEEKRIMYSLIERAYEYCDHKKLYYLLTPSKSEEIIDEI